jgi:SAM-dependent methyltransferase
VSSRTGSRSEGYEPFYRGFDSKLMRQIRREAYGEDIGQHSWVSADELRLDIRRLRLSSTSRLLDLGCGPCGPLTFLLKNVGCRGTGFDVSPAALRAGRERADELGVGELLTAHEGDLDKPLPFESGSFDAVISLDVALHLRDRAKVFGEIARVLSPGGRFLFTDAGVVTGAVTNEEFQKRSVHGYAQFVPPGWNETLLEAAGLPLLEVENRTASIVRNAVGRLAAMAAHREELERTSEGAELLAQTAYLEVAIAMARRGAMSRMMYLAEVTGGAPG